MRPDWDSYFMNVVEAISARSTCDRGRPGCVIVKNHQILATGYAGSPPGLPHCDDAGHLLEESRHIIPLEYSQDGKRKELTGSQYSMIEKEKLTLDLGGWVGKFQTHCIRTIHAEINAINQAAKHGQAIDGATIYISFTPCYRCAMSIISVGIRKVICNKRYENAGKAAEEMFSRAGIDLVYLEDRDGGGLSACGD
jgi:dCMP deaminase